MLRPIFCLAPSCRLCSASKLCCTCMGSGHTQLEVVYDGPVFSWYIPTGCVRYSQQAIAPKLLKQLFACMDTKNLQILQGNDLDEWRVSIIHPDKIGYTPFFFFRNTNRGTQNRIYLECLCHAVPDKLLFSTPTARYFTEEGTIDIPHARAPWSIVAFVESIREINQPFLEYLESQLLQLETEWEDESNIHNISDAQRNNPLPITRKNIENFVSGIFRNVAIQQHYGDSSDERHALYHFDHVFSALHLSVTLHGSRSVGFLLTGNEEFVLDLNEGTVSGSHLCKTRTVFPEKNWFSYSQVTSI
eukprot:TRINITY_DN1025_c0_g1_i1.p1 TRINITY_DN1025_c0_g1~~TRINITY_DN1025_c0_g1_i1.p1  ORF type:complete len:303 (-),score=35.49 TRINITY_DN1025_c0_g1_i1:291-1199(-)